VVFTSGAAAPSHGKTVAHIYLNWLVGRVEQVRGGCGGAAAAAAAAAAQAEPPTHARRAAAAAPPRAQKHPPRPSGHTHVKFRELYDDKECGLPLLEIYRALMWPLCHVMRCGQLELVLRRGDLNPWHQDVQVASEIFDRVRGVHRLRAAARVSAAPPAAAAARKRCRPSRPSRTCPMPPGRPLAWCRTRCRRTPAATQRCAA
jgi:hypothetical protein